MDNTHPFFSFSFLLKMSEMHIYDSCWLTFMVAIASEAIVVYARTIGLKKTY